MYTIGIKRRILPGYKKYQVSFHQLEVFINGDIPHLALHLAGGGVVFIPQPFSQQIKIFSDYDLHKKQMTLLQSSQEAKTDGQTTGGRALYVEG